MALIQLEIPTYDFGETINLPFLCLFQSLCEVVGVLDILDVDRRIDLMSIEEISLIKDLANSILTQRAQPPPTMLLAYFERLLVLRKAVNRPKISDDFEMG